MPMKLHALISIVFFVICLPTASGRERPKMSLKPELKMELNKVLKAGSDLHEACISKDEKKVNATVEGVISAIDTAEKKTALAEGEKPHLDRILNATKMRLQQVKKTDGDDRKDALKEGFIQLVQISQLFPADPSYSVFFCSKDKSVWLQKGKKAKNPIHPDTFESCGKLVQ